MESLAKFQGKLIKTSVDKSSSPVVVQNIVIAPPRMTVSNENVNITSLDYRNTFKYFKHTY